MNSLSENGTDAAIKAAKAERAHASVDLSALLHNLQQAQIHCPSSHVIPVVKSDAYGHGMIPVADAILNSLQKTPLLAVATFSEALELQDHLDEIGAAEQILLLSGFQSTEQLEILLSKNIEFILHRHWQVSQLLRHCQSHVFPQSRIWLKQDTGMHRLGMSSLEYQAAVVQLRDALVANPEFFQALTEIVMMSHLASADSTAQECQTQTANQIAQFEEGFSQTKLVLSDIANINSLSASFAASSGILAEPKTHRSYIRPGIMLYGSSPFAHRSASDLGLLPVMTLRSKIMAVKIVPAGEAIGYGGTHVCAQDTRVGVVAIGYGDGYPRAASNGAPVAVQRTDATDDQAGSLWFETKVIGRVSMDMITVDLTEAPDIEVGAKVELWGTVVSADAVAEHAGTIAYELFCQVSQRVGKTYV